MRSTINGAGGIHGIIVISQFVSSKRARPMLFYTLFFRHALFAFQTHSKGCNRRHLSPVHSAQGIAKAALRYQETSESIFDVGSLLSYDRNPPENGAREGGDFCIRLDRVRP
jgi:hypothetical protein